MLNCYVIETQLSNSKFVYTNKDNSAITLEIYLSHCDIFPFLNWKNDELNFAATLQVQS